jgi:hypothetical protein
VVEGARLESVYRGNSIAGSNPALSAVLLHDLAKVDCGVHTSDVVASLKNIWTPVVVYSAKDFNKIELKHLNTNANSITKRSGLTGTPARGNSTAVAYQSQQTAQQRLLDDRKNPE